MSDHNHDVPWDPHLAWHAGEPSSSLLEMLHEPERLMCLESGEGVAQPHGDDSCTSGGARTSQAEKRDEIPFDDSWEDPPSKLQASGSKLDAQAAKAKANREKQRREQLKHRYTELAALIEPGKPPKTDRNLILEDAIRVVSQLRAENNQLRQLNKFLEERVQMHEQARGQALYQQSVQMQGGLHPCQPNIVNPNQASTSGAHPPVSQDARGNTSLHTPLAAAPVTSIPPQAVSPSPASHAPMSMEANLAIQMMNVAMQLLKGKGDEVGGAQAAAAAEAASAAVAGASHAPSVQHLPQVPQTSCLPPFAGVPLPLADPADTSEAAAERKAAAQPPQTSGHIGFKPQAAQLDAYCVAQSFSFPPNGPMPPGWPPASMVDQNLDSKLRPPAA